MGQFLQHSLEPLIARLSSHSKLTNIDVLALRSLSTVTIESPAHRDVADSSESVWIVLDGMVGRYARLRDGERQITSLYFAGEPIGLHTPESVRTADWGLHAFSRALLARVSKAAMRNIVDRHPGIVRAFLHEMALEGARLSTWIVNTARRRGPERMAHLICEMAFRQGFASANAFSFRFDLRQADLADMLAMTFVHVSRTARALRERGLLIIQRGNVEILDWKGLQAFADFDPAYLGEQPPASTRFVQNVRGLSSGESVRMTAIS